MTNEQLNAIQRLHDELMIAEGQRDQARAERDALRDQWSGLLIEQARLMALRDEAIAERDALRKRLDEWVQWGDRMASGHPDAPMASLDHEVRAVIANRYGMSIIDAVLEVQP